MKISVILGTRPEAIKLAPVILALRRDKRFDCHVCSTGQHRQMLEQVLPVFGIEPDVNLALMTENQTLAGLSSKAIAAIDAYLKDYRPDVVVVQGDTTTVFCGALAAFYNRIPVAHVEAGLRTHNLYSPWPEEANRQLVSRLVNWHFAPTEVSRRALLSEGIPDDRITVTGNTVIDALIYAEQIVRREPPRIEGLAGASLACFGDRPMVLITGHRRENFGVGFRQICTAIVRLVTENPGVDFVYPVHMNPNVRSAIETYLGSGDVSRWPNLHLIAPQPYLSFVALMSRASFILTDSGGVQEEAPSLGKPVLVMRDTTERPEAIEAGTARLVGALSDGIVASATALLQNTDGLYTRMAASRNPYGDGHAAEVIVEVLRRGL